MTEIQNEILNAIQRIEKKQRKQLSALSHRVSLLEAELNGFKQAQTALDEGLQTLAALSEILLGRSGKFRK